MLSKSVRLFLNFVFALLMISMLIWHDLVIYGLGQGIGQLKIVRDARPIAEVLADTSLKESQKKKLELIGEIRQFAFDSLGINYSENYSEFYDQGKKPILLTVSACKEFSFEAKEWTFPFLGTVSYKGYFNFEKARKEILKLRSEGYDVDVYSPSGWSTLGWFKDPVLSGMLNRDEGELADLIIHELTHGTLYVKNDVTFNENLASFIGDKGAQRFLIQRFGKESKEYLKHEHGKVDDKLYNEYILKSTERLDSLYQLMGRGNSEETTRAKKKKLIQEIALDVYHIGLHDPKTYFKYTLQAFHEGNAFFMTFSRYDSQYELFDKEYRQQYQSDLKAYLEAMKEKYPSL